MSTLDDLLHGADPARARPSVDPDGPEAEAVLETVLSGRSRHPRPSRHRRAMLVGMAAASLVLAVVLAVLPGGAGRPTMAAAATLLRLSRIAAAKPALRATGPGQYYFTSFEYPESVTIGGACGAGRCLPAAGTFTVRYQYLESFWIRPGGRSRVLIVRRDPVLDPATRDGWLAAGRPSVAALLPRSFSEVLGPRSRSNPARALLDVRALPTSPAALAAAVDAGPLGGPDLAAQNRFDALAFVLSTGSASPQLRAAALRVLASIPGVRSLGVVRDSLGRRGDAFEVAASPGAACGLEGCPTTEMVLDPASGLLLAAASRSTAGVTTWTTYVSTGIASSLTTTPQVTP